MPLDPFYQANTLNWITGGATPVNPTGRWINLATGSPNQTGGSDGPFTSRQTMTFAAANSPQGSKTNLNARTFQATAACTVVGWNLYDSSVAGSRIAYGTFTASLGCASADTPNFAVGAVKITLA